MSFDPVDGFSEEMNEEMNASAAEALPTTSSDATEPARESDGQASKSAAAGSPDEELSPAQLVALNALISGTSASKAAKEANVSRATLHRWQTRDAAFIAVFNSWQRQAIASARGRLLAMSDKAITAVQSSLFCADGRTALMVLKDLGILAPIRPGPDTTDGVRKELAAAGTPPASANASAETVKS